MEELHELFNGTGCVNPTDYRVSACGPVFIGGRMDNLNLETLDTLVRKGNQLKSLLTEEPNLLRFLELLKGTDTTQLITPIQEDRLVGPKQVLNILKISSARLEEYVRDGVLTAYYTPPSSGRKFWLSEVMAIPRKH